MSQNKVTQLKPAIFLDRDGTLNIDNGYTHRVEDLCFLPNVIEGLKQLQAMGFVFVIVTNQSGVGRGYYTVSQMQQFNAALCDELAKEGVMIDAVYHCTMHPKATLVEHQGHSPRRKPEPGMLLEAAADCGLDLEHSVMIGDKYDDVSAGHRAGCRSILIATDGKLPSASDAPDATPDAIAEDLLQAAAIIAAWQSHEPNTHQTTMQTRSDS